MKGLYTRVIKGIYPRIPKHFSEDLSQMIALMLSVDPEVRPSADDILRLPVF